MRVTPLMKLYLAYLLKFPMNTSDTNINAPTNNKTRDNDALILTPLIEKGKIDEARRQALVNHEEMQNVESYAGYLTVNKTYNSNMFFWYFPAQKNPRNAPVLLFLSGGPGVSSLRTALYSGPFMVTQNLTLKTRVHSWHTHHNVIYLENPIGTGYSFTDDDAAFVTNQTEVGRNLLIVLLQFFQLFPELTKNDFYLIGDSYGGKFGCSAARSIKQHNDAGETKINLAGIVLLAAPLDPQHQLAFSDYWHEVGLIDTNGRDQVKKFEMEVQQLFEQQKYEEAAMASSRVAVNLFTKEATLLQNYTGYFAEENNLNIIQDKYPDELAWIDAYVASAGFREALHVGKGEVTFSDARDKVRLYLKFDIMQSAVPVLADLLRHYRVMYLSGQMDTVVPYPRTQEMLWNLDWPGVAEFRKAERRLWRVDGHRAGYAKSGGNLTEVMVRNAGHMMIYDQTYWVWTILNQFTGGDQIP